MQCDICLRTGGDKLPLLCPVDARNQIYEPRVQNAIILLEKDQLDKEVTTLTSDASTQDGGRFVIESDAAARELAEERTRRIIARADELRAKVQAAKVDIARRKTTMARRKSELASAKNGLEPRRVRLVEEAIKATKMKTYRWNNQHVEMAQSRAYLVTEAAKLYGLQRQRDSHGALTNDYSIAGVPILDLRAMCNKARATEITSSLTQIARLLVLSAHYFSLRLPAEITLPHREYPLPTIFHIKDSYTATSGHVSFHGSTPVNSTSNSPSNSRHEDEIKRPRPRPLYINKPLPALSKEDLSYFLEGVTLLAYNVAWMCKTQGITVGSSKGSSPVEDIFEIGANLFKVLIGSTHRPSPPSRIASSPSAPTNSSKAREPSISDDGRIFLPAGSSLVGYFSHGTAHTFLGAAQGSEFQRSFKLPSPTKVVDQLKAHVLSEIAGTEWTIIADDASLEGDDDLETGDGVLVGGNKEELPKREARGKNNRTMISNTKGLGDFGAASFMTMQTVMDPADVTGEKKSSNKGWTLLKDRS